MRKGKYITWSELKVGIMVVATSLILAAGIFFLGQEGGLFMKRYPLKTYMERINGLQIGAPVWLAGVKVGSVTEISFPADITKTEIEVTMEIDENVRERIREDSRARIGTLGLLGDKFVSITQGTLDHPILTSEGIITGDTPVDVEQLIANASGALENLAVTIKYSQSITKKIDEGTGTLGKLVNDTSMIDDLNTLTTEMRNIIRKMNEGTGTLGLLLNDPGLYTSVSGFVRRADSLAQDVKAGKGTLGKLLNDPVLYERLTVLSARMDSLVVDLRSGEGTAGRFITDPQLYEEMNRVSVSLRELLEDVKKNPKRYINVKIF
jgi:phospholipid/cholesterol/gamma-HCH transport system substrate-binding protein